MEALERECIVPVKLDGAAPPLAFRHAPSPPNSASTASSKAR
jgi:hypothetical protein